MPGKIFVYKCIYDDGGAPCIDRGLLTLAICKPKIRSVAQTGDWIFGFGGNNEDLPNRLVYIAEVSKVVDEGRYYSSAEFRGRKDCIYRRTRGGELVQRKHAKYHHLQDHRAKDLGPAPNYPQATTLVCEDFRYFGDEGTNDWQTWAPELTKLIRGLGQGHRRNHTAEVRRELKNLKTRVWRRHSDKVMGQPLLVSQLDANSGSCDSQSICCHPPKVRRSQRNNRTKSC